MALAAVYLYAAAPAQAATTLVVSASGHGTRSDCTSASGTAFPTIAAAYAAAADGDTIFVCPGTYPEHLTIAKAITLEGAQAGVDARGRTGSETVMGGPDGAFLITVPGVTVDGFTFQGQTSTATQGGTVTAQAGQVTVTNDIFQGNQAASVLIEGPAAGVAITRNVADSGISLASASNVVVSQNAITSPATGYAVRLSGGDQNVVVTGNSFVGGRNGIVVRGTLPPAPNSGVTATGNCIAGNTTSGLTVQSGGSTGSVQASANWWGSVNGPSGTGPGWGDAWVDPAGLISAGAFLTAPLAAPCPQLPSVGIVAPQPITRGRSGTRPLAFTVHLSAPYVARTAVGWATVAGTAQAGTDFVAASGTLVIPAGRTTATLTVKIVGDITAGAARHFTVVLSSPVNATLTQDTATATVRPSAALPATGPGPTVIPVGGVATGGTASRPGAGRTTLWALVALSAAIALLAAVARLFGAPPRRVVPLAGAGCMAVIAAAGLLLAGGRAVTATSAQAAHGNAATTHGHAVSGATAAKWPRHERPSGQTQAAAQATTPSPGPPAPSGMRVQIPAIGVSADVVRLGLNADSTLQVPSTASDAGWWSGGTRPGRVGPAVIVGHVNWNGQQGVFGRLSELQRGAQVLVTEAGGAVDRYVVTGRAVYPKSHFPTQRVYGPLHYAGLRLITCSGSFDSATGHYVDNLIVFARLAGRSPPSPAA